MSDKQGIEIDYCPQCRGVWLDRGELDKIIERSPAAYGAPATDQRRYDDDDDDYRRPDSHSSQRQHYSDNEGYSHKKKHKKEGFLGDLFDF